MKPIANTIEEMIVKLKWDTTSGKFTLDSACVQIITSLTNEGWELDCQEDEACNIYYDNTNYPDGYIKLWRSGCSV